MQDDEARGGREARQFAGGGYEPTRKPRLRPAAVEPPPLPAAAPEIEVGDRFGDAPEDGLRMLAALETLTSLEPDFCDDLAAEASVTIIERVGYDPHDLEAAGGDARSLRERLHDVGHMRTTAMRPAHTARWRMRGRRDVEIDDVAADVEGPARACAAGVAASTGRGRVTSRFQALSGGR
jgi:hypothetical protein